MASIKKTSGEKNFLEINKQIIQDIPEKDRWLFLYTFPCHFENQEIFLRLKKFGKFNNYLNGNSTKEKIKEYFFTKHNNDAHRNRNYNHMLIPYRVIESNSDSESSEIKCSVLKPFFELPENLENKILSEDDLIKAKGLGIIGKDEKLEIGDIVLIHGGFIVDIEKNGK